jgi:hypothetical protein
VPAASDAAVSELSAELLDEPQAVSISIEAAIIVKNIFLIFMLILLLPLCRRSYLICTICCFGTSI